MSRYNELVQRALVPQPQPAKAKKVCGAQKWVHENFSSGSYIGSTNLLHYCQRPLGHSGKHSVRIEWGG